VSGRHRRSSDEDEPGERRKRIFTWIAWTLVVALLGGNLAMSFLREPKNDKPQGFLTPDHLRSAAFWLPIACTAAMSVLGLYWSSRAYSQSERSSLLWARRGYVFGLVAAGVLTFACFDPENFPREWFVCLAAALVAGQAALFAMLSFKEYRRAQSGGGGSGRRGRSSESTPSIDETSPTRASSPDAAK
jgi:hypothetical protein